MNPPSPSMSCLLLSVYIITFLLGFPANVLAFCTFCMKLRRKPTPMDIFLLNLTISDLIFLIFLPLKMKEAADDMYWNLPYALCPVSSFFFFSCIYTSTFFLTSVAVERYLAVAFPIHYNLWRRPRYAIIACVFFWLVSALNLSITYIIPIMHSDNGTNGSDVAWSTYTADTTNPKKCYDNFENNQLRIIVSVRFELFLVLFLVPFLICCFCYINFIRILSQLPTITRHQRLRGVGLAAATLLVFIVCFAPYNISHVVGYVHRRSEKWRDLALISTTLNACLDPMIFYFSSSTVRRTISFFVKGLREKIHVLHCPCHKQGCQSRQDAYIETGVLPPPPPPPPPPTTPQAPYLNCIGITAPPNLNSPKHATQL